MDSFVFHASFINADEFTVEEIGRLTLAMIEYAQTGKEQKFKDRALRTEWARIRQRMDEDRQAYEDKCRTNRENGKKGGRPKTERLPNETEKTERFLEKPKKPYSYSYSDSDSYRDNTRTRARTKFSNFDERKYDFGALEGGTL